jgi:hypothetical protein
MNLDDVKRMYNIEDMVGGLKGASCKYAVCPLPQHVHSSSPSPSFSIFWKVVRGENTQFFKCHGNCGLTGDVIDFIGFMFIGGYKRFDIQMRMVAAEYLTNGKFEISPPNVPPPTPELPQWLASDILPPSPRTIEYAEQRGIPKDILSRFGVGTPKAWMKKEPYSLYSPEIWMAIPTFQHNLLQGIKLRNLTDKGPRYLTVLGSKKGLWNHDNVWMRMGPTFVVKGELAGLVMEANGFRACAPTGGEGSYVTEILEALSLSDNIVIGDPDNKGREAGERRAALLDAKLFYPPIEGEDIDKWILRDPQAISKIRRWIDEH